MRLVIAILLTGLLFPTSLVASPLEKATERELMLLRQELKTLKKLKASEEIAARKKQVANQAKLTSLTALLLKLRDDNQSLTENSRPNAGVPQAQQAQLLERAVAKLNTSIKDLPDDVASITTDFERMPEVIEQRLAQIYQQGVIHTQKNGTYFDEEGSARKSDILWISQISAIALDSAGGPLLPTESGHLQLAPHLDTTSRRQSVAEGNQLPEGGSAKILTALLFDPEFIANNQFQTDKTLLETIEDGGLVMWPILLLALFGILICLERLWSLNRVHTNAEKLMHQVDQFIQQGQWAHADEYCEKNPGVVAKVMRVILKHRKLTREQMEDRATEVILTSRPDLERFLSGLNVIAAVTPLLGLLGTVTGMIATFLVITHHGTGDPKLMAGGISEALLTTQYGLMVAIPALMAHSLLSRWVEHILGDIETNSLQLLNSIEHLAITPLHSKVHQLPKKTAEHIDA